MSDNPRIPGHPSDMPSSRSSGNISNNPQQPVPYSPPPPVQPVSNSGRHQSRNIILGAVVTVLTSTLIYYLTVFQNKPKQGGAGFYEVKEATISAWKRYVTVDNIYYKNIVTISRDTTLANRPEFFKEEIMKESGIFKNDTEEIMNTGDIDATLKAMMKRRIERQNEFEQILGEFADRVQILKSEKADSAERARKITASVQKFFNDTKRMYDKGILEIEDICRTLEQTYMQTFDPNDLLTYIDYKKFYTSEDNSEDKVDNETIKKPITEAEKKYLPGDWDDKGNAMSLEKDGSLKYSMASGDNGTGTWKIENNKLRIDSHSNISQLNYTWYFNLSDIKKNSFTMTLTVKPYDTYHLTRVNTK